MKWVIRKQFADRAVTVKAPGVFEVVECENREFLHYVMEFCAKMLCPAVVVLDGEFLRDKPVVKRLIVEAYREATVLAENNGDPDFQVWLTPDCSGASEEEVRALLGIYTGQLCVVSSPRSRGEE